MSEKVLITAINSFTGKYLSSYLQKKGFEVIGTTYEDCDITNKNSIKETLLKSKPDYIIHLAGISFAAHANNESFYKVNTIGTLNILDTLLDIGHIPKKVILASSATVYGKQSSNILSEEMTPIPANHYGASKYAMESLAKNYFDKLPILITRPFNYTGIGQEEHFLIPKIVNHFKKNEETIELGNLDVKREFNDVNDIVEIYEALLKSNVSSTTVNLCSSNTISLLKIIDLMNELAGYEIQIKVNPNFVRKDEIKELSGSIKKLASIIKLEFKYDIKQTLQGMYHA